LRKASSMSDVYEDEYGPLETDSEPHINTGPAFQAKVKKWAHREITDEERAAIPDRDDAVFDLEAYELLACSQAVPRPGRNKELALHLLMENKGNIQAAVMDLMKCDILDWEQYPIIYNSTYADTVPWLPEEILSFQDAIYKSEKDFHQVAIDLGNKTVKQCVEFYYMWKKACPDDYRKLRNLRRKRQLLEMQQKNNEIASSLRKASTVRFGEANDANNFTSNPVLVESLPRTSKKGAQPSADGYFHCRLCDKYFEKVKSLNAHMKSHAMKARAEAEAQAQMNSQLGSQPIVECANVMDKPIPSTSHLSPTLVGTHQQNLNSAINPTLSPRMSQNALLEQNQFGVIGGVNSNILAQDLLVQSSLSQEQFPQNAALMRNSLGQVSLGTHSAFGQTSSFSDVLSRLPHETQKAIFLNVFKSTSNQ
uniref:C2H2-type domain-containing protein n=1 Tax=Dracunculus medinensis TaxID=318479 RepID=A0A158Q2L9_DRAME